MTFKTVFSRSFHYLYSQEKQIVTGHSTKKNRKNYLVGHPTKMSNAYIPIFFIIVPKIFWDNLYIDAKQCCIDFVGHPIHRC